MDKVFVPHELKTIEIDVEKKILHINGEDFGKECTGFSIHCSPKEWNLRAAADTTIHFATYDEYGVLEDMRQYETNDP